MDMLTLAMAKAYTDQKAGYTEPGKVYTFDGNAEETQKIGGITYAKIADTAPNLHNVTKAVYTAPDGSTIEFPSEKLTVEDIESQGKIVGQRIKASLGGQTAAVSILDNTGLWVYAQPGYGYCSLVEFAETVHPIDPKYIPWDSAHGGGSGGGLPVVEFTTQLETGVTLTDAENAALHEAFNAGTPLVIDAQAKCGTSLLRFMTVINPLTGGSYDYFAARVTNDQGDFNLYFKSLYGGTWSVTVEALGTLPIVNDCPINLIVGTYTLDATNSDKVRAAYNMNLPIVIKGYCNAGEDDDFNPIEFKYAILFQVDLMNGKLLGQYGDKRITISNLKDYGNCSYTVATA